MLQVIRGCVAGVLLATLAAAAAADNRATTASATAGLPLATPESQGMSSSRLDRPHAEVRRLVDEGLHSGVGFRPTCSGRSSTSCQAARSGIWRASTLVYTAIADGRPRCAPCC